MIWGISCLQFCKKSADHKEGNTCSEVPMGHLSDKQVSSVVLTEGGNFSCKLQNNIRRRFRNLDEERPKQNES